MSFKEAFDLSVKAIATAVAIFGVWKYFEDRSQAVLAGERGESLRIIREYSSSNLLGAREALIGFWRSQPEFVRYIASADSISANEYSNFVRRVFPSYARFDDVQSALYRMNDYYDTAYYCRTSGLCDADLLDSFLCDKAAAFSRIYGPFFQVLNRQIASSDYGRTLDEFTALCAEGDGPASPA